MPADNTQTRREYLVREWSHLNDAIDELRRTMSSRQNQKAVVVDELRETGLSMAEVAKMLGVSRQTVYSVGSGAIADKRIHEEADGSWSFYCPHQMGENAAQRFPDETMAVEYAKAHDKAIHRVEEDGPR